jgi:hypothetical protein
MNKNFLKLPSFERIEDLFPPQREYQVITSSGKVLNRQPKEAFYVGVRTPTHCLPEAGYFDSRGQKVFYGQVLLYAPPHLFIKRNQVATAEPKLILFDFRAPYKPTPIQGCFVVGNALQKPEQILEACKETWRWLEACRGCCSWDEIIWQEGE